MNEILKVTKRYEARRKRNMNPRKVLKEIVEDPKITYRKKMRLIKLLVKSKARHKLLKTDYEKIDKIAGTIRKQNSSLGNDTWRS